MITRRLLRDEVYRTVTTPVGYVLSLLGSFMLARVTGQFIVRLKLFSKRELSIGLDFKSNVLYKSIASKNTQSDMNSISKNSLLNCIGQLGL